MRFLTWCNKIDERSELLFASAKHFGIDVEPIGLGKEYRGGVSKIEWLYKWIMENKTDDTLVCVDAFDCIWLRPADGMQDTLDGLAAEVIYAGEKWYRKRPPSLQGYFDLVHGRFSSSIYRYPNCGCVCGNQGDIGWLLEGAIQNMATGVEKTEQWYLTEEIAIEHCYDVQIDYDCDFFWCCAGQWRQVPKLAHIENGRLTNLKTGGQPYVLHAPIPNRSRALLRDIAGKLGVPLP